METPCLQSVEYTLPTFNALKGNENDYRAAPAGRQSQAGETRKLLRIWQSADHQHELSLERRARLELFEQPGERAAQHLLVHLGQLAGDRRRAVAELGQGVREAGEEAVGGLEDHQGMAETGPVPVEGAPLAG